MKAFKVFVCLFLVLIFIGCGIHHRDSGNTSPIAAKVNTIQRDGENTLNTLKAPVKIVRDEKGMPYIYAESLADGITAQGFVTAQDRLVQLEIVRRMSNGRYGEIVGESALKQDIFFRSLGFLRHAGKHAQILDGRSRRFIQWYVNGVNAYITQMKRELPYEFELIKLKPEPWTVEDVVSVLYMIGFTSSGNYESEVLFSKIIQKLGPATAMNLVPIDVGPECKLKAAASHPSYQTLSELMDVLDDDILAYQDGLDTSHKVGSNNWVVAPKRTKNKAAILAGDPHLPTDKIPTTWYPTAIITPEYRMVGATIPGAPGFYNLKTEDIAIGLTNSYIDCQDVYVLILDPENPKNYLEGKKSVPFDFIEETIKVRDATAPSGYKEIKYPVMLTRWGPVFFKSEKIAMTLRWAPFENMTPSLSMLDVITSKSVEDLKKALEKETMQMFNRSFIDSKGNIGWQTTGRIPIRSQKASAYPQTVKSSTDNWTGWIAFDQMPHSYNPQEGWIGNANNKTVDDDFPYYLSSEFASHYRFARMKEILNAAENTTADDHWMYQRDTKNILAEHIAPVMAKILSAFDDTKVLGRTLSAWDFHDDMEKSAPAIFQTVMINAAYLIFKDELGEDLAKEMLKDWYFWQVRFEKIIASGDSRWFDIKNTKKVETIKDIIHQAGLEAQKQYGEHPKWGDLHQINIVNALIAEGPLKSAADGGKYRMSGSGETLYRAKYHYDRPYDVYYTASLRMVADMSDPDKVLAALPGGTSGRIYDRHYKDQLEGFMKGEKMYWWFSDKMIKKHAESTLTLKAGK